MEDFEDAYEKVSATDDDTSGTPVAFQ